MIVVVALLITVSAFSEGLGLIPMSARQLGMGGAAIAVADDAFAWTQNPAGLASLASKPKEGAKWTWDVAGSYTQSNNLSFDEDFSERIKAWDIDFAANDPEQGIGFGGGWADAKLDPVKIDLYGAGFGMKLRSEACKGLSWGVNVQRAKLDVDEEDISGSKTIFNAGLMYEVPIAENKAIKLGLVCNDVTDELGDIASDFGAPDYISGLVGSFVGRSFSFGLSLPVSDKLMLAVDNRGVGELARTWSAGLEWKDNGWAARVGDWDGSLTFGAGYKRDNWFIDAAYGNSPLNKVIGLANGLLDPDEQIPTINFAAVTVGVNF